MNIILIFEYIFNINIKLCINVIINQYKLNKYQTVIQQQQKRNVHKCKEMNMIYYLLFILLYNFIIPKKYAFLKYAVYKMHF